VKQISKKDWERLEGLLKELGVHKGKIEAAILAAQNAIDAVLTEANETREEIRGVLEDWCNEAESYYDERSEKWQQGDAGDAYSQWMNTIQDVQARFDMAFEVDLPTDILEEIEGMEAVTDGELSQSPEA